jgi:hypothetical protein
MRYTDSRVSELETAIGATNKRHFLGSQRDRRSRFQLHAMLITFGILVSVVLLISASASPVMMALITGGPSILTEVIDYLKRL